MKKKLIVLFFLLPIMLFSQGMYLTKGQSGFGTTIGYGTNDDLNALIAGFGYSFNGNIDIGFFYDRGISKDEPTITVNSFNPTLTIYPIKQNQGIPISIAAEGSYIFGNMKSDIFDYYDVKVSNSGYSVGGFIFSELDLGGFSLIPTVGFAYISVNVKMKEDGGDSLEETETNTTFNLAIPIVIELMNNKFSFSPGIGIDENNTSFTFSLDLILPI